MRFVNKSLPDGVYAGHAVLDGFTEDYPEAHAAKLVPLLSRFYGLMPEGEAPEVVSKAMVEFAIIVPDPDPVPYVPPVQEKAPKAPKVPDQDPAPKQPNLPEV